MMKTQIVLSSAAACFLAASCTQDPALAEKKNTMSIGRHGVIRAAPDAAAVSPEAAAATPPETTVASPETAEAPTGPAAVASEPRKKPVAEQPPEETRAAAPEVAEVPEKRRRLSIGRVGVYRTAPVRPAGEGEEKPQGGFSRFKKNEEPVEASAEAVAANQEPAAKPARRKAAAVPVPADPPASRPGSPLASDLRLPNLLGLPEEKDLKATNPSPRKAGESEEGAVIARPPVEKKD